MSAPTLAKIAKELEDALLAAAWAQWRALGMGARGGSACRSVVDPEALVLASLWLEPEEARLWKLAGIWARSASRLLSVQRMKNLLPHYPEPASRRLGDFAGLCVAEGKDARWRPLVKASRVAEPPGWKPAERATPLLHAPASLVLRLRMGMGVGIKADVLAFLIGSAGARRTIREITEATLYHRRAVQRSVEEMVAARMVAALPSAPATYRVQEEAWVTALELGEDPPLWRFWHQLFVLGGALDSAAGATRDQSAYIQSSRARDILERHRVAFDLNAVPLSDPATAPGEAYLDLLQADVARLADAIRRNFV
jgi:hypothetical protein